MICIVRHFLKLCDVGVSRKYSEWVNSPAFLRSHEWAEVRYKTLRRHGGSCLLCGRSSADGAKLSVDHIKPRRHYPGLALDPENLQVLCGLCNWGKGNRCDDWRKPRR